MIVLVIAAHPDDEALGCGATMAWHADRGDSVNVLFLADGETSRHDVTSHAIAARSAAARDAARILGARPPLSLSFPDQRLDSVPFLDIVQSLERVIAEIKPDTVYTHFPGDLNKDHAIVARAAMTACRPQPGAPVKAIYAYEVLSATNWFDAAHQFSPQRTLDVISQWPRKMAALHAYQHEMRASPHARSYEVIEALGRFRGGLVGVTFGEAFVVLREVIT
jgi:LmbE family N-acetylglucosaminyl deacetylase